MGCTVFYHSIDIGTLRQCKAAKTSKQYGESYFQGSNINLYQTRFCDLGLFNILEKYELFEHDRDQKAFRHLYIKHNAAIANRVV